jgi:hypothetical protein
MVCHQNVLTSEVMAFELGDCLTLELEVISMVITRIRKDDKITMFGVAVTFSNNVVNNSPKSQTWPFLESITIQSLTTLPN